MTITKEKCLQLLKKYAPDGKAYDIVLRHSEKVTEVALRIARKIPIVDLGFVETASLLHDIGRFKHPPGKESIKHGITGGAILQEEGLPKHAQVCEKHLGVGISKEEIVKRNLPLPPKDYIPETIEEKIITYADNLIASDVEKDIHWVIDRYRREIGEEMVPRIVALHNEIEKATGGTNFL